jgi:hypothetical protein
MVVDVGSWVVMPSCICFLAPYRFLVTSLRGHCVGIGMFYFSL